MKGFNYQIRKIHRYLGLFIGIQFLLWTVGGLYFTWSDMDEIHGDYLVKQETNFWKTDEISGLVKSELDSVSKLQLIQILDTAYFQVQGLKSGSPKTVLLSLTSFKFRKPLNVDEAIEIANNKIAFDAEIKSVKYVTETDDHHEYRGGPLPVWAITYDYQGEPTAYVAAELGQFITIRHNNWRVFDWLWMLHTMDYSTRDEIGNTVLRGFSILGLVTIMSGFTLYFVTSPTIRKIKGK